MDWTLCAGIRLSGSTFLSPRKNQVSRIIVDSRMIDSGSGSSGQNIQISRSWHDFLISYSLTTISPENRCWHLTKPMFHAIDNTEGGMWREAADLGSSASTARNVDSKYSRVWPNLERSYMPQSPPNLEPGLEVAVLSDHFGSDGKTTIINSRGRI